MCCKIRASDLACSGYDAQLESWGMSYAMLDPSAGRLAMTRPRLDNMNVHHL